jgi:hypothetical protein
MATVTGATSHVWSVTGDATVVSQSTVGAYNYSNDQPSVHLGQLVTCQLLHLILVVLTARTFAVRSTPTQPGGYHRSRIWSMWINRSYIFNCSSNRSNRSYYMVSSSWCEHRFNSTKRIVYRC